MVAHPCVMDVQFSKANDHLKHFEMNNHVNKHCSKYRTAPIEVN